MMPLAIWHFLLISGETSDQASPSPRLHLQSSLVSQFLLVFSWNDRLILRLHFNYRCMYISCTFLSFLEDCWLVPSFYCACLSTHIMVLRWHAVARLVPSRPHLPCPAFSPGSLLVRLQATPTPGSHHNDTFCCVRQTCSTHSLPSDFDNTNTISTCYVEKNGKWERYCDVPLLPWLVASGIPVKLIWRPLLSHFADSCIPPPPWWMLVILELLGWSPFQWKG